jgi:hypothetical protein
MLDLFRLGSGLTWRKLLVLAEYLPPESALNTAIRNSLTPEQLDAAGGDPTKSPWSHISQLLAVAIDELRNLGWAYAQVHSKGNVRRPEPIPRPGMAHGGTRRRPMRIADAKRIDPRLRGLSDEDAAAKLKELTGRG